MDVVDSIFEKLPSRVNEIEIKKLSRRNSHHRQSVSYLMYSGWTEKNGIVSVTETAYFSSGNLGGCRFTFERNNGQWKEQKRDCFAMAS